MAPPGMNLRPAAGEKPTQLSPFAGNPTGHKRQSNLCNEVGRPRARACQKCVKGVGASDPELEPGRGSTKNLEVFSCLVDKGYGNGGKNCARCIGLNTSCTEIPSQYDNEVKVLMGMLPEYNRIAQLAVVKRSAGDKDTLTRIIASAATLSSRMENYTKAQAKDVDTGGIGSSPAKGSGSLGGGRVAGSRGLAGDAPATKSDIARLERMISSMIPVVNAAGEHSFHAERIAREARDLSWQVKSAWKRTATKGEAGLEQIAKVPEVSSDIDEDDLPPTCKPVV